MNENARLTTGERHDVTVEPVTDDGDTPVANDDAIRVRTDDDRELWLLTLAGTEPPADRFEAGRKYDLEGVLGYDPTGGSLPVEVERVTDREWHCPECGEPTEFRPDLVEPPEDVDSTLRALGIEELVLVETDGTTVVARPEGDDWSFPDGIGAPSGSGRGPVDRIAGGTSVRPSAGTVEELGEFVCPNCGHATVDARPPERGRPDDEAAEFGDMAATTAAPQSAARKSVGAASDELGMATGGAKDVANFRDNVEAGHLPQPEAVSDEGLFYDYYFDTGEGDGGDAFFYPTYSAAVTTHPLSGETERYLTVGLNSTLTEADFERKALDLVAVLDVSGSMDSQFDDYYYDRHGRKREVDDPSGETKMAAARESLVALTEQLDDDDRLGVVLYNSAAGVAKPIRDVASTDMDAIRGHVREIRAGGGTDMAAGYRTAREMLAPYADVDPEERERRIVFMTDAMPNLGTTGEGDLVDLVEDAAADGVYTTFVGMGIDSNAELIDALSGVRGANHYFVHSAEEFRRRLGEEFEYMVTPLVFELSVDVVADGYEIGSVYGSPNDDAATGEVMHVTTLFPSASEDGETRGGVVLLQLRRTGEDPSIDLEASWVRRDGTRETDTVSVTFPGGEDDRFDDSGVRKAVLLARYADLLREWIAVARGDDRAGAGAGDPGRPTGDDEVDDWRTDPTGEWERESVPLSVPDPYGEEFARFRDHLLGETEALGDDDLRQEAEILRRLAEFEE